MASSVSQKDGEGFVAKEERLLADALDEAFREVFPFRQAAEAGGILRENVGAGVERGEIDDVFGAVRHRSSGRGARGCRAACRACGS